VKHPAESPEVEADRAGELITDVRFDAAADRGAAAVRDDGDSAPGAPVEDRRHVLLGIGQRDQIRRLRKLTPQCPDEIAIGLPVGVAGSLVRFLRAEPRERGGRRDPWRTEFQLLDLRRLDQVARAHVEVRLEDGGERVQLFRVETAALLSPTPELAPGHEGR